MIGSCRGLAALAAVVPILLGGPALAQQPPGAEAYRVACAQCHGERGQGDGPMRAFLTVAPADLTTLRQRAPNGEFPFYRIFQVVDGRAVIPSHGSREMPTWGAVFSIEAGDRFGPYGRETYIRGRIVELVTHIELLQR